MLGQPTILFYYCSLFLNQLSGVHRCYTCLIFFPFSIYPVLSRRHCGKPENCLWVTTRSNKNCNKNDLGFSYFLMTRVSQTSPCPISFFSHETWNRWCNDERDREWIISQNTVIMNIWKIVDGLKENRQIYYLWHLHIRKWQTL